MEIQLLFFGIATDLVGKTSMVYKIEENTTIAELKNSLISNFSGLKNLNEFAMAVNEEYADDDLIITNGAIVAIIPPVSGG